MTIHLTIKNTDDDNDNVHDDTDTDDDNDNLPHDQIQMMTMILYLDEAKQYPSPHLFLHQRTTMAPCLMRMIIFQLHRRHQFQPRQMMMATIPIPSPVIGNDTITPVIRNDTHTILNRTRSKWDAPAPNNSR